MASSRLHSHARYVTLHTHQTNKMAYAQVSLVSAVKAAPTAKVSRNTRRNTTAVKVVANKAGAARVEVARKAAPVALSVGECST